LRIRHPRHATVIAYLALFVALGGTGYAAVKINGSNLVNNSVAGKKLKRNTIGAREVNEAKLGTVRSATTASSATTAGSAATAGHATTAGQATTAGHATSSGFASRAGEATKAETAASASQAANATLLDGLAPEDFLSADTILRGVAPLVTPAQLIGDPELGFAVNSVGTDGDALYEVVVVNSRPPGGADIALGLGTDGVNYTLSPGDSQEIESTTNVFPPFLVADTAGDELGVLVTCSAHLEAAGLYCYGVLI